MQRHLEEVHHQQNFAEVEKSKQTARSARLLWERQHLYPPPPVPKKKQKFHRTKDRVNVNELVSIVLTRRAAINRRYRRRHPDRVRETNRKYLFPRTRCRV